MFSTINNVITTAASDTKVASSSLPLCLRMLDTTAAKIPIAAIRKIISIPNAKPPKYSNH